MGTFFFWGGGGVGVLKLSSHLEVIVLEGWLVEALDSAVASAVDGSEVLKVLVLGLACMELSRVFYSFVCLFLVF